MDTDWSGPIHSYISSHKSHITQEKILAEFIKMTLFKSLQPLLCSYLNDPQLCFLFLFSDSCS